MVFIGFSYKLNLKLPIYEKNTTSGKSDSYFIWAGVLDADEQWTPRRRLIIHPTIEEQAAGITDFTINWKHGFAVCKIDSMIYTRGYNGQLVKFNPVSRKGQLVEANVMPNSDSYLQFDPKNPNILYLSYQNKHCIYTYDIITGEHKLFAGMAGNGGWKDGYRLDALLMHPRQLIFDEDNNIILADGSNHCIRKITPEGMVSTIIGMGGKAGYQDGNPDDALFNDPRGVVIDSEYTIYIADYGNNCIRKLSIE